MVRSMHFGPHFSESLKELSGKGFSTGLVLGSQLGDRAFAVCLVETPAETTDVAGAEAEKTKNIDVSWMLEHAKQVYRLLPGNKDVMKTRQTLQGDHFRWNYNTRQLCLPHRGHLR